MGRRGHLLARTLLFTSLFILLLLSTIMLKKSLFLDLNFVLSFSSCLGNPPCSL